MYTSSSYDAAAMGVAAIFVLFIVLIVLVCWLVQLIAEWKLVNKLGGRGWSQIIPVYNAWELSRSAGCEQAMVIAYTVLTGVTVFASVFVVSCDWASSIIGLCALAVFVVNCLVMRQVAKRFSKSTGFTVGLVLLPVVFVSILGFGSDKPADTVAA